MDDQFLDLDLMPRTHWNQHYAHMYQRFYARINPKQVSKAQKLSTSKAKAKAAAETPDQPAATSQVVTANTPKKPVDANLRRTRFSKPAATTQEPAPAEVQEGIYI